MANLAGWPYWKVVSITGQAGSGTDYQVELEIGDSAGGDFHLEGHCTNFPQDLRITDDDGTTLLDHFVEDITADPIVVHVEVKDDLGSNQTLRVYYGKSGETTASNGTNTFIQYHGTATSNFLDTLVLNPTACFAYRCKARSTADTHNIYWGVSNHVTMDDDGAWMGSYSGTDIRFIQTRNEEINTTASENPDLVTNQWYIGDITFDGTTMRGYWDDNEAATGSTTNLPDETLGLSMRAAAGSNEQSWSFIRKYNSPEPAFSSAGAEQTPGGVAPTGVFYGPLVGPFGGPI